MDILKETEIECAVDWLRQGEVVAFPTETVYGLGAPIFSARSIAKIFEIKGRPSDNPLIAHISDLDMLEQIVSEAPDTFYKLADAFFPGPLTVILPVKSSVPSIATAGLPTVGVRMPQHPIALELIARVGEPLVAPSANISGKPSATCAAHVVSDFEGRVPCVLDGGPCEVGLESTVLSLIDPEDPVLYRPGAVSKEEIEQVLGRAVRVATKLNKNQAAPSPGLKYRHYAPNAPVHLFQTLENLLAHQRTAGKKALTLGSEPITGVIEGTLNRQTAFHLLRKADLDHYEEVLILLDPMIEGDEALMNRLTKAAHAHDRAH